MIAANLVRRGDPSDHARMVARIERRTHRSSNTSIALDRWLHAIAARNGLEGLVLGDRSGLLIAKGAVDDDRAEAMAAVACLDGADADLMVLTFEHEGAPLVLAGRAEHPRAAALADAQVGVERILSERLAA